ncbi:hypothetical protein PIB30_015254 [Stylosanthes scabra]|uniref:Uncharacterized protein n=1 Tax=Stylosanthes scabra TaxID=79078 RepID=A0ABU6X530_9FABA|nr:hypothetical protein [Stylosanthes scabra]
MHPCAHHPSQYFPLRCAPLAQVLVKVGVGETSTFRPTLMQRRLVPAQWVKMRQCRQISVRRSMCFSCPLPEPIENSQGRFLIASQQGDANDVTGKSYAGHYISALASRVHQGNQANPINIKV